MKKKLRTAAIALCCIILLATAGYGANGIVKDIQAHYVGVKLVVDGTLVEPKNANGDSVEPFIYNGTTYLPVRCVAEALGEDVLWDGASKTVYIGDMPGNADKDPVSITSLKSLNSYRWNWNQGRADDPFGNNYSSAANYVILHNQTAKERYVEYRVYGDYKKITGVIAPHADIDTDGIANVFVYADDKLVYSSPNVKQKTDAFDFSVDIEGAEYIKIVVRFNDYYVFDIFVDQLILSDIKLWP